VLQQLPLQVLADKAVARLLVAKAVAGVYCAVWVEQVPTWAEAAV
jgi:hypothetical protein